MSSKNTSSPDYSDARKRLAMDYARQLLRTPSGKRLIEAYKKDPEKVLQTLRAAHVLKSSDEYIQCNPQLRRDVKELNEIKKSLPSRDQSVLNEAYDAACGMALSGNMGDYKKYAAQLVAAQAKISKIDKIRDTGAVKTLGDDAKSIDEKLKSIQNENDDSPVPDELLDSSAKTFALLSNIGGELTNIRASVGTLIEVSQCNMETAKQQLESVEKLLETAKHNETSSEKNAQSSNQLAKWAIRIAIIGIFANAGIQWHFACRAEKNDKTGELIEVVRKSHPWCEQQIGAENAKNISVAFHAVTQAMQENIQNKHEISRLQEELKKSQDRCKEIQREFDKSKADSIREQQRLQREINSLQSEIAALKKKIEVLEAESAKKSVPPSASEAKK